jgi:hypothetical protein
VALTVPTNAGMAPAAARGLVVEGAVVAGRGVVVDGAGAELLDETSEAGWGWLVGVDPGARPALRVVPRWLHPVIAAAANREPAAMAMQVCSRVDTLPRLICNGTARLEGDAPPGRHQSSEGRFRPCGDREVRGRLRH